MFAFRGWPKIFSKSKRSPEPPNPTPRAFPTLAIETFGFARGQPPAADLIFDVRALPNPFYDRTLQPLTGLDPRVGAYFAGRREVKPFLAERLAEVEQLLATTEGQHGELRLAIGCTGGRHRSVYVAEAIAETLRKRGVNVRVRHRELGT